jgi:hypothetical protein
MIRMMMRVPWPSSWYSARRLFSGTSSTARHKHAVQRHRSFSFIRIHPTPHVATERPSNPRSRRFGSSRQGKLHTVAHDEKSLMFRAEVPALTITASPSQGVEITGQDRPDWSLHFCAYGEANSEDEARDRMQKVSLVRSGSTVSLNGSGIRRASRAGGNLIAQAPAGAPITVHASFAPVAVRDMTGPVRMTAIHARAKILNSTGKVDATAFVVDFEVRKEL